MRNGECGMSGVMLSEAKHLNRENRPFASLRVTTASLRVTAASLRVTTIPHSHFSIPPYRCMIGS